MDRTTGKPSGTRESQCKQSLSTKQLRMKKVEEAPCSKWGGSWERDSACGTEPGPHKRGRPRGHGESRKTGKEAEEINGCVMKASVRWMLNGLILAAVSQPGPQTGDRISKHA